MLAAVGFQLGVNHFVLGKDVNSCKCSVASFIIASKRFFAGVNPFVYSEVASLCKCSIATFEIANKRLLACVNSLMSHKKTLMFEGLSAHITDVAPRGSLTGSHCCVLERFFGSVGAAFDIVSALTIAGFEHEL